MPSNNHKQENRNGRRLGIHPMFEGVVLSHSGIKENGDLENVVRKSVLYDTAEAAFAYSNLWDPTEFKNRLKDTIISVRDNQQNPDRVSKPTMQYWCNEYSDKSIDETTEGIHSKIEEGVKREHDGLAKFLTRRLIGGKYGEPSLTTGGILSATVGRRGDERKDPAREIRIPNAEIIDGKVNIAGLEIADSSPIYTEHLGKERRHGYDPDIVKIVSFQTALLSYYVNKLDPEKKKGLGFREDFSVFMPYDFEGHEELVIEILARRYARIKGQAKSERSIFKVSTYLNDHPEIFTDLTNRLLEKRDASIGVGKLSFEDKPHRSMLKSIENLLVKEFKYRYNGFAVDFRNYGEQFQTVSIVYTRPDKSRSVHVIYDEKFDAPPLFLFKITRGALEDEQRQGRIRLKGSIQEQPKDNPFETYGRWFYDFDRHSQSKDPLVNLITRPDKSILEKHRNFEPEYQRFEQQLRK